MTKTTKEAELKVDGIVLYCDGGTRPQPGHGGFGIHGYTYSNQTPKKGTGNQTQYLFSDGYQHKSLFKEGKEKKEITPIQYVSGFGTVTTPTTNNVCELVGAFEALNIAQYKDSKTITIYSDSKLVIQGATQWLPNWKNNNWTKSDGQEIANINYWKDLDNKITELTAQDKVINFKWTKGHSDCFGNNVADTLATIGVMHSTAGHYKTEIKYHDTDGFWKTKNQIHPFLTLKRLLFCSTDIANTPGEYYLADHDKDDDILGKRIADATYAYVKIKEPDPVIEMIKKKQIETCENQNKVVAILLDQVTSPNTYEAFIDYGDYYCYQPKRIKADLVAVDKTPVTLEMEPIRLSIRAIEAVNTLAGILNVYKTDKTKFTPTDITDLFYEKDKKGNNQLKSTIGVGFKKVDVVAGYEETKTTNIELFLDVDFMPRNALKKLETSDPTVTLLTWLEGGSTLRYATVCTTKEGDEGIWCGFYSNMKFIFD